MFFSILISQVKVLDRTSTTRLPFPSVDIDWPLFAPRSDTGIEIMGLFAAGADANGACAPAVSVWTTPKKVVSILSKDAGKEVRFNPIPVEDFQRFFPDKDFGAELAETMRLAGEYNF